MVFQSRKNRRGAKQGQLKTVFTKLPDELLLHVLHQMDITEVLKLRETSRFFVPTCTEVVRDRLKVLYVHPSPSAIKHAISICDKSNLSSRVEEICFLSKAPFWRDGPCIEFQQRQWSFHNPRDDVDRPVPTFEQSYQELLSSLAKLDCIQTVSFQESCDRPGFNMSSAQRITDWQDAVGHRHKERRGRSTVYGGNSKLEPPIAFLFADVDALNAVLRTGINFTRLILPHELFGDTSLPISAYGPCYIRTPLSALRPPTLTRLDFTVTAYWKYGA